jgi:hypothetical protein
MDNKFILESYYDSSSKLGNRAVALSLSGLGIIWLFKTDTDSGAWLTSKLLLPGAFFVCSVALDLFQTAYGVFSFGALLRKSELQLDEYQPPAWIRYPTIVMFYGKFAACVLGYILLLSFVLGRFQPT